MTIKRVTGVYPLNEAAFVFPEEQFEEFELEVLTLVVECNIN